MSAQEADRQALQGPPGVVCLSMPQVAGRRERFEVSAAVCELELVDGLCSVDVVELAHHQEHRYSLVVMTAAEACDLARLLVAAADKCPQPSGPGERAEHGPQSLRAGE